MYSYTPTHTHTHHRRELTHGREDLDRQGTDRQRIMALKRVNKELQDISKYSTRMGAVVCMYDYDYEYEQGKAIPSPFPS